MKKILLTALYILLIYTAHSQNLTAVVGNNNKYGFINHNNDTVIECIFDYAEDFSNEIALVKNNPQFMLIDTSGVLKELSEVSSSGNIRYNMGEGHTGLPLIVNAWECAYIDKMGKIILEISYQDAFSFSGGKAKVIDGDNYNFINKKGALAGNWEKTEDNYHPIKDNGKYGYIDRNGKLVLDYQFEQAKDFNNGLAQIGNNRYWAIINKEGKIISDWYNSIGDYKGKIAIVKKSRKYGFINKEGGFLGKWFTDYKPLGYGMYRVEISDKYSVVNADGKIVIDWCEEILDFYNGLIKVKKNNEYAYLNTEGEVILGWYEEIGEVKNNTVLLKNRDKYAYHFFIDTRKTQWFDSLATYNNGFALAVKDNKYYFINKEGFATFDSYSYAESFRNGFAPVEKDNQVTYINTDGEKLLHWNNKIEYFHDAPPQGLVVVRIGSKYGYKTLNGKSIIDAKYDYAENFRDGIALVKSNPKSKLLNLDGNVVEAINYSKDSIRHNWGNFHDKKPVKMLVWDCQFLNTKGELVLDLSEYHNAYSFADGKAKVIKGDKFNYINKNGDLLFKWNELPQNYHATAKDGKFGYVDKNNKIVIDYKFDYAYDFKEGIAKVREGNKYDGVYFLINEKGKTISGKFDAIADFSNEIAIVEKINKNAIIDKEGNITSNWYDKINDFQLNTALVQNGNKFGFINNNGDFMSQWYDEAKNFVNTRAKVKLDGKWGFVNEDGVLVVKTNYDFVWDFNNNLAKVQKDKKFNFVDKKGELVSNGWYEKIYEYSDGLAAVCKEGKWGYINIDGLLVIDCIYDRVFAFTDGSAMVIRKGVYINIDKKGEEIIEEIE